MGYYYKFIRPWDMKVIAEGKYSGMPFFWDIPIEVPLNGYYSYALWDALDPDTIVQLKTLGYDVDVGTRDDISWFIITWGENKK